MKSGVLNRNKIRSLFFTFFPSHLFQRPYFMHFNSASEYLVFLNISLFSPSSFLSLWDFHSFCLNCCYFLWHFRVGFVSNAAISKCLNAIVPVELFFLQLNSRWIWKIDWIAYETMWIIFIEMDILVLAFQHFYHIFSLFLSISLTYNLICFTFESPYLSGKLNIFPDSEARCGHSDCNEIHKSHIFIFVAKFHSLITRGPCVDFVAD